jgi:DNA-directed RNA polymerase, mitochondrial
MKNYTIIATLARPIQREDNLVSIMSSCYVLDNLDLEKYLHKYSGEGEFTVIIVDGEGYENEKPKVTKHSQTFISVKLSYSCFFKPEILRKFISRIDGYDNYSNNIYIFKNTDWSTIVMKFRLLGIIVSGGKNNKRHLLSHIEMRLALFLYIFSDLNINNLIKKTVESYFSKDNLEFKRVFPVIDYTKSDNVEILKNWLNDEPKKEWLYKSPILNNNLSDKNDLNTIHYTDINSLVKKNKINNNFSEKDPNNLNINDLNNTDNLDNNNNLSSNYNKKKSSPFLNKDFSIQKRDFHSSILLKNIKLEDIKDLNNKKNDNQIKISKHLSFYLENIKEILNNNNIDLIDKQYKIENLWVEIFKILNENSNNNTFFLKNKLFEAKETLNLLFEKGRIKNIFSIIYPVLNKIEILMIVYSIASTYANKNIGYTYICSIIGKKILYYIYLNEKLYNLTLENKNFKPSDFIKDKYKYSEFVELINFNIENLIKLGDYFLNILMNYPSDIYERNFDMKEGFLKNETAKLEINPLYLEEYKNNIIVDTAVLPMVCEPNKWSQDFFGGYLNNKLLQESLITGSIHHGHCMNNKDSLYKAVNKMSSIKFKINNLLLDYILNEGNYLINSLNENNSILNGNLDENQDHIKTNNSDELQRITTIQIAKTYSDISFFLPLHCDWRGRIYTKSFFIDYQGDDLSLSLIEFNEGIILSKSGLESLYIYGANNYNESNISKDTYPNRIKWVLNNMDKILKMDSEFILKAENKFVFSAFCLVIRELKKNPNYLVKLPVWLDATCSGIQHLAAIMRDFQLASEVNLIPQKDDEGVADIYNTLRIEINERIRAEGRDNYVFSNLEKVDLQRSDVKTPIMTKSYNVTLLGIKEQLISKFEKKKIGENEVYKVPSIIKNETVLLEKYEIFKIAQIINDTIFTLFPSLDFIYKYFINMTKLLNKIGIPVIWLTPSGLELTQKYFISKQNKIAINFAGRTRKMIIKEWTKKVNKGKQSSAIIPNIIHSLDASHLINVINSANSKNINSIITVHDCFGTHPNNLDSLSHLVKIEFIKLYTQTSFLEKFHNRNKQNIEDNDIKINIDNITGEEYIIIKRKKYYLPNIPKLGNLNLNNIINSKYMIT